MSTTPEYLKILGEVGSIVTKAADKLLDKEQLTLDDVHSFLKSFLKADKLLLQIMP